MKNIKNEDCLKLEKLIPDYLRDILSSEDNDFVKSHLDNCENCKHKYSVFKSIYDKFRQIERKNQISSVKNLTPKECITFSENLSAYIDNELMPKENLEIRKILIKNEYAKENLQKTQKLISLMKTEFEQYLKNIKFKENIRNMYFCMNF